MTGWTLKRWVAVCALGALIGMVGCDGGLLRRFQGNSSPCPCEQKANGPRVVARLGTNCGRSNAPWPPTVAGCAGMGGCAACATQPGRVATRITSASPAGAGAEPLPSATRFLRLGLEPIDSPSAPAARRRPARMPATLPDPNSGIEQVSLRVSTHDTVACRKGYADLTVQPWFDCAEDHSWLQGRIFYSSSTRTWRLHYASVDDTDPYGGTVTLTGGDRLKPLKDGMAVRIKGHLLDPDRREPESPYQVSSFEILDKP